MFLGEPYNGEPIAFGQKRIGWTHDIEPKEGGGPIAGQAGETLDTVAANIRNGFRPKIYAYRLNGQVIVINNRTLADYALAGVQPTDVEIVVPTANEYGRLLEMPGGPSMSVPVTLGKDNMEIDPRWPVPIDASGLWP